MKSGVAGLRAVVDEQGKFLGLQVWNGKPFQLDDPNASWEWVSNAVEIKRDISLSRHVYYIEQSTGKTWSKLKPRE